MTRTSGLPHVKRFAVSGVLRASRGVRNRHTYAVTELAQLAAAAVNLRARHTLLSRAAPVTPREAVRNRREFLTPVVGDDQPIRAGVDTVIAIDRDNLIAPAVAGLAEVATA